MKDFADKYQNASGSTNVTQSAPSQNPLYFLAKELTEAVDAKEKAYIVLKDYEKNAYIPAESWWNQVNDGNHPKERASYVGQWQSIAATRAGYSADYEKKNKAYEVAKKSYDEAKKQLGVQADLEVDNLVKAANEKQYQMSLSPVSSQSDKSSGIATDAGMNPVLKWSLIGGGTLAVIGLSYWLIKKFI